MLTKEQEVALQTACNLYKQALEVQKEDELQCCNLLKDAFRELIEYIDEVDDIYYRVVFAVCVDEIQERWNVEFGDAILHSKVAFFVQAAEWFLDEKTKGYNRYFTVHFFKAFTALARMYLNGEHGVNQSDEAAYAAYTCAALLDEDTSRFVKTIFLSKFVKDDKTGKMVYTGIRPKDLH